LSQKALLVAENCAEIGNCLKSRICFGASCTCGSQPASESKNSVIVLIKSYDKSLMKSEQLWILHIEGTRTQFGRKTVFSNG